MNFKFEPAEKSIGKAKVKALMVDWNRVKKQSLWSYEDLITKLQDTLGYVVSLVHKGDISRLAYVRGKTVRHLCGGGYDTLEKIAAVSLPEMEEKIGAYYRSIGSSLADFKAVIPLAWMIGGARTLPVVLKM